MLVIFCYIATIFWIKFSIAMLLSDKNVYFTDASDDIADLIAAKKYIANVKKLPTAPLIKNIDNDATYLLSKLSDNELLKLLDEQPARSEFNLNDILRIIFNTRSNQESTLQSQGGYLQNRNRVNIKGDTFAEKKRFNTVTNNDESSPAYFKLNHRTVEDKNNNYKAFQKLKNLLNVYESKIDENFDMPSDDKKELLFDILVTQLKSLCCTKSQKSQINRDQYDNLATEYWPSLKKYKNNNRELSSFDMRSNEYMFLIINDEITSNGSDTLMAVDPESLDGNSSVLLLGPVTAPLSDAQLKLVMNRISNELFKPEYQILLQQLSNGVLINKNKNVMKNFVFGPETRRYIKPHRCNHQSKLAKVYGGPKWIICTGYLNLNKPSLYD